MSAIASILSALPAYLTSRSIGTWLMFNHRQSADPSTVLVQSTIANLLKCFNYHPPNVDLETKKYIEETLRSDFSIHSSNQAWFDVVCAQSAAMGYFSYFGHTREVQLQAARFTWFMIYFDDFCHKFPASMQGFQRGMLGGTVTDKMPIFEHFRNHLVDMYELWDEIPANCINTSAMEYINGCSLEETPSIRKMKLRTTARAWPPYLRTKTGVAAAYGFMIFPRSIHPDMSVYIQAIGDICTFIDLTNDVLSFHKETLAGEKTNYIHNRAFVSGMSVEDTLLEVVQDVLDAHARIIKTLSTEDAVGCWKNFVNGYLAFHVTQSRYRLSDLGF